MRPLGGRRSSRQSDHRGSGHGRGATGGDAAGPDNTGLDSTGVDIAEDQGARARAGGGKHGLSLDDLELGQHGIVLASLSHSAGSGGEPESTCTVALKALLLLPTAAGTSRSFPFGATQRLEPRPRSPQSIFDLRFSATSRGFVESPRLLDASALGCSPRAPRSAEATGSVYILSWAPDGVTPCTAFSATALGHDPVKSPLDGGCGPA
jgi:hypothetical protein